MGADQGAVSTGVARARATLLDQPASLYAVLVVGVALRVYKLGAESYWIDEFSSIRYVTTRTPVEVVTEVPFIDPHPPLYYLLFDLWTDLVGYGEAPARLLSALLGIAAIPMLYLVGAELYDRQVGVVSAGILAVSRFHIEFSQTARMYALLVFTTLLSMYFLLQLRSASTRRNTAAYFGATVALVYSHVFGLLVVAAQHCYVLAGRAVRDDGQFPISLRRWIGLHVGIGLFTVPWGIGIGQQALEHVTTPGGSSGLDWIPEPTVVRLLASVGSYLNPTFSEGLGGFLVLLVVGLLAVGSRSRVSLDREQTLLLACWICVPVLGLFAVSSLLAPLFVARYTSAALPAVALLLGKEIRRMGSVEMRSIAVGLLVLALLSSLPGYYQNTHNTEWRESANHVADVATEDDLVLVHRGYYRGPFAYYLHEQRTDISVERLSVSDPVKSARTSIRSHEGDVWLVFSAASVESRTRIQQNLTQAGYQQRIHREYTGVTVYQYVTENTDPGG